MTALFAQAAPDPISWYPFVILAISVSFIVIAITRFRFHPFLALICSALIAGWLSSRSFSELVDNTQLVSQGFGQTASGVALVIALAALIGMCLMESGAADQIVRRLMKIFGEKNAGWALMVSGFLLSIPVFFDTVFFLLIPLARMLGLRTGRNYLFYVMAIGGGGAITHSIVPPTPGPLLVGGELKLDLGVIMMAGLVAGLLPAIVSLQFSRWLDLRMPVPVRATEGSSLEDLKTSIEKKESDLPSFTLSLMPVILPAILIATFSFIDMFEKAQIKKDAISIYQQEVEVYGDLDYTMEDALDLAVNDTEKYSSIHKVGRFFGDKVIALGIGALIALLILLKQSGMSLKEFGARSTDPLTTAAVIILITSAGGAFGAMIRNTGIGDTIRMASEGYQLDHMHIVLAWVVTAVIRIAQGSATVAMITGASLMSAVLQSGVDLSYHPLYIFLAIGFGSITCSWMNDSGFWIVCKLSGFTEKETLKSWTTLLTLIAVIGLLETFVFSYILPFK